MSLHNLDTTITPEEHAVLNDLLALMRDELVTGSKDENLKKDYMTAARWMATQGEKFYQEWKALDNGSHLKAAYADQVWTWSDRDLDAMPSTDPSCPPEVERP